MSKRKPLVVLAGWLGCQKRSLRRYETLFQGLGYQVLSKVASPSMVVDSCFQEPPPLVCPPGWPVDATPSHSNASMQSFAWQVLQEIHHQGCDHLIFYAFSNGGCFVWETVRRILDLSLDDTNKVAIHEDQLHVLQSLRQKATGVVLDSCPSKHLAGVGHALALCSVSERMEVMRSHGMDVAFFPSLLSEEKQKTANTRGQSYYNFLLNDASTIPQLYLYSESDILIPIYDIDKLVERRRQRIGADRVFSKRWKTSRHCAHIIDNQAEYEEVVKSFLQVCQPKPLSKL